MNKKELRAEMARHGDTNESLADYLGISAAAFSKKINAERDFRQTEIARIILRYSLTAEDVGRIFFAPEVV
jgi:predicted transcriptional regulator